MSTRILHIVSTMDPKAGGVSQAVKTMVKGLLLHQVSNTIVCLDDENVKKDYKGFNLVTLGKGTTSWNFNSRLHSWLKIHLAEFERAIVHGIWQYQDYAVLQVMSAAKGTKIYVMPHGMLDPYFQRASGRRLKALRNDLIWKLIDKQLINKAEGLLFTCETEKILARESFGGYRPKNELVVGLGVEKNECDGGKMAETFLKEFPAVHSTGYLLFISRIHPKKGLDLLIEAYLNLKKQFDDNMLQLVVAGPGLETAYGEKIKAMAAKEPNIVFTGMLAGELKWGAFHGCGAFVLPSHQENFGIAVVEAMSCNKPVLISDQVNIWREIKGKGGGLIAKDTPTGIETLLKEWLTLKEADKQEMARKAVNVYQEYFTVETAAKRLKEAIKL